MEIASLNGTMLIYPHNQITYKYRTNQVQSDTAWQRYINQVLDIPSALLVFEKYMKVKEFNLFSVRKKLYSLMLRKHFSYLSKKQRCEFFVNFVKVGKFDSKLRLMTAPLAYCLVIDMLSLLRLRLKRSPTWFNLCPIRWNQGNWIRLTSEPFFWCGNCRLLTARWNHRCPPRKRWIWDNQITSIWQCK